MMTEESGIIHSNNCHPNGHCDQNDITCLFILVAFWDNVKLHVIDNNSNRSEFHSEQFGKHEAALKELLKEKQIEEN